MGNEDSPASLWRTRALWAALGASVSAAVMWNHGATAPDPEPGADEGVGPSAVASPSAGASGPGPTSEGATTGADPTGADPTGADPMGTGGGSTTGEASAGSGDGSSTGEGSKGSSGESTTGAGAGASASASADAGEGADTSAGDARPDVPLPWMPGSRFMRRARRPNDDGVGWLVTLGLSVPAPGTQVEAFYRSALKDEGMKVFGGGGAIGSMGEGHRATLRARGRHASAEVTIHQRPDTLRSVVRIYWRTRE